MAGWCAHIMEQYRKDHLIRPLTRYNGPKKRSVPRIEEMPIHPPKPNTGLQTGDSNIKQTPTLVAVVQFLFDRGSKHIARFEKAAKNSPSLIDESEPDAKQLVIRYLKQQLSETDVYELEQLMIKVNNTRSAIAKQETSSASVSAAHLATSINRELDKKRAMLEALQAKVEELLDKIAGDASSD